MKHFEYKRVDINLIDYTDVSALKLIIKNFYVPTYIYIYCSTLLINISQKTKYYVPNSIIFYDALYIGPFM